MLLVSAIGWAQISPGDLSNDHAKFEGMGNCTLCHELGNKVTNAKCLDCHSDIQGLISQDRGFHANSEVERQNCTKCHSEHHGRKFDMVRFDENNFDHDQTNYSLDGAHAIVDCKKCHTPDNINKVEIRKRKDTYLGLDTKCLSCHDDFHQGTLPIDCLSCHQMDAFTPVTKFNHENADFKLRGEHITIDCKECHKTTIKNGKEFQQFSDLAFNDCKSCHQDTHNNQIPGQCKQCHVEDDWNIFQGNRNFNHNATEFDLNGVHKTIDCFACHDKRNNPLTVFQDRSNVAESNCVECHQDPHENKFGQDCAKCHQESSFLALKVMDFFDHNVADFPLEGMHIGVDCKGCHIDSFSNPIDFSECKTCHIDYHEGEFVENSISPDCKECHSIQKTFEFTSFTIAEHQKNKFPLEGAHLATPCFACHVDEASEKWHFRDIGEGCIDCHNNFHEDAISEKFLPNNDCASCHGNESWDAISFNHSQTDWPLTGRHTVVSCSECHFEFSEKNEIISQNFVNLLNDCASCHNNTHGDTFAISGVTDCNRCHVTTSWFPEKFNHNETRFPLEGKHEEVNCRACHEVNNEKGESTVIYKLNKLDCIDCHT
jgi:hypothetical protein